MELNNIYFTQEELIDIAEDCFYLGCDYGTEDGYEKELKGDFNDWLLNKIIEYPKSLNDKSEQNHNPLLITNAPLMFEMLKKAKAKICSLKLSILSHPDHKSGSEFDDQTESSQELEDEIEQLLINATKID
jgi:hypothetical protein